MVTISAHRSTGGRAGVVGGGDGVSVSGMGGGDSVGGGELSSGGGDSTCGGGLTSAGGGAGEKHAVLQLLQACSSVRRRVGRYLQPPWASVVQQLAVAVMVALL